MSAALPFGMRAADLPGNSHFEHQMDLMQAELEERARDRLRDALAEGCGPAFDHFADWAENWFGDKHVRPSCAVCRGRWLDWLRTEADPLWVDAMHAETEAEMDSWAGAE